MKLLLAVILMGAVEDEGTFWIQLLMVVILAAGVGVYALMRSRSRRVERQAHDETIETIIAPPKPAAIERSAPEKPSVVVSEAKPRGKDLAGGMELLARNFLVSVVDRTDSSDQKDIEMRRLCFTELARRGELWSIASVALKVYTLDEDGFYGKIIRCEAMAELAGRTGPETGDTAKTPPSLSEKPVQITPVISNTD